MAQLVFCFGTSHSPTIMAPPELWTELAARDARDPLIPFARLTAERQAWIGPELEPHKLQTRHTANLNAVATLADAFTAAAPDVVIVIGDDQRELLWDDNYPSIAVYWGERIPIVAARESRFVGDSALGRITTLSYHPDEATEYAGHPELGRHLIEALTARQFDVAHIRRLSNEHGGHGLGHAWNFVWKNIMPRHPVPMVPVILNTCYPPNRPTVKRCYELGRAIRLAVEEWDTHLRVAIGASGGLTHQVVEEDLDRQLIGAMQSRDVDTLTSISERRFDMEGTSESKNWIVVAGAAEELTMRLIDYVPCYRTVAGTGVGMCFATWT
jgi:hypothetical protein